MYFLGLPPLLVVVELVPVVVLDSLESFVARAAQRVLETALASTVTATLKHRSIHSERESLKIR